VGAGGPEVWRIMGTPSWSGNAVYAYRPLVSEDCVGGRDGRLAIDVTPVGQISLTVGGGGGGGTKTVPGAEKITGVTATCTAGITGCVWVAKTVGTVVIIVAG
jgi:hypothetical protein